MTLTPKHLQKPAKPIPHYIVGWGLHGCLYYGLCRVCHTYADAVGTAVDTFALGRTRKTRLQRAGYLELTAKDGAEYCRITACDCDSPWEHDDNMTDDRKIETDQAVESLGFMW